MVTLEESHRISEDAHGEAACLAAMEQETVTEHEARTTKLSADDIELQTTTARAAFERAIENRQRKLDKLRSTFEALERDYPDILDTRAPSFYVHPDYLSAYDGNEPSLVRGLCETLLDVSNKDGIRKQRIWDSRDMYARFLLPDPLYIELPDGTTEQRRFYIDVNWRGKTKCRRARVTKTETIEVCGTLDETKYDSITWLDD